jgi:hypothetical protein
VVWTETAGIRKEGGMLHNVYTVPTEVLCTLSLRRSCVHCPYGGPVYTVPTEVLCTLSLRRSCVHCPYGGLVYTVPTEVLKDNKARLKWVLLLWMVLDHSCFVLGKMWFSLPKPGHIQVVPSGRQCNCFSMIHRRYAYLYTQRERERQREI